jgi:tetratricopeptide (TPR) repeat protein
LVLIFAIFIYFLNIFFKIHFYYAIFIKIYRLRKVQNYDWADDYIKKGTDMMNIKNYEKAIEYFKNAEKLDSLNKDLFIQKGLCYFHLVS